jgi:hypothetical protein
LARTSRLQTERAQYGGMTPITAVDRQEASNPCRNGMRPAPPGGRCREAHSGRVDEKKKGAARKHHERRRGPRRSQWAAIANPAIRDGAAARLRVSSYGRGSGPQRYY